MTWVHSGDADDRFRASLVMDDVGVAAPGSLEQLDELGHILAEPI